ncbi:RNA-dependent RNA polymerase [Ageratum latent virus 1998]|uniref:RNA-directed RNA polymerase 2a n=1 Tax=Ageratum latent virus 1998 TaxID=2755028 RepID=S4UY15_9BROM|nr:RNA-dependent RNA polymerase [Ageratum latent virus 1998]AGN29718.1 RNA-dependent RNA polymerase [Ageratum latent virus 1998]
MDTVKSELILMFLSNRLRFYQSFEIEQADMKDWVKIFLFKFVIEHTAKFDFATVFQTFEMVLGNLGYVVDEVEEDDGYVRDIDPFYLPYDDLDVDYTSMRCEISDDIPDLPSSSDVENYVENISHIPEGTSWASVSDTLEEFREEYQDLKTNSVSFEIPNDIVLNFDDDDGQINDLEIIDAGESMAPEVSADADIRTSCFVSYITGSDLKSKWRPKVTQVRPDPSIIQDAVDELFPNHHCVDDRFFQEWVETHDIDLEVTNCNLDMSNFNDWTKGSDTRLCPTLQVGGLSHRVPTQREALVAIKKRNMNVPELQSQFDHNTVLNTCVQRFLTHVIDKTRMSKLMPISGEELYYFNQYIENKNPPLSEYKGPIPLVALDRYMHMIKTTLKPVEEDSLHIERPVPATITYHKKGVVMMTSPYFLCAMVRLLYVLKSKFTIPTGKYHQIFQMDPKRLKNSKFFKEIDFSKFDKSQGHLHHDIQWKLLSYLGMPEHVIDTWFNAHEVSHIYDQNCGIGFSVDFQRRTGDACTYLGNTLVTLSVLSYVYDLSKPDILFVTASGDDSLIGSLSELPRDREDLCVSLFNFETKFPHNQPFICSKFLLVVDCDDGSEEVLAVPNPLKLLQKLGPKNLQVTVLDDYYQSLCDILWVFEDADICKRVADLAEYRRFKGLHKCQFLESALLSLPSLVANRLKFIRRTVNLESSKVCIRNDVYSDLVTSLDSRAKCRTYDADGSNRSRKREPWKGGETRTRGRAEPGGNCKNNRRVSSNVTIPNESNIGRKKPSRKGGFKLH